MIIEHSQQNIEFYERPHTKKVLWKVSGGADSAMIGYMLTKFVSEERPDITIIPITTSHYGKPYQIEYAEKVIGFMKQTFGEQFFGKHYTNEMNEEINEDYTVAQKRLYDLVLSIENFQSSYTGITINPPENELDPFGGPVDNRSSDKTHAVRNGDSWRHFANIDKKGVAELYNKFGLMDTLYPLTRSCEEWTHDFSEHCGECWFCKERYWGFGRYV